MTEPLLISPPDVPASGTIRPPGSKSITNRALVMAALAEGQSRLEGLLDSRDTQVMIESLGRLGIEVTHDPSNCSAVIEGCAGKPPAAGAQLWLENSGTSIRFLTALCTLGNGTYRLDGNDRMRERPIGDLVDALNLLGADVRCEAGNRCPPVIVNAGGLEGGRSSVSGAISSQYLSGLLMTAPYARSAVEIAIEGELVSEPYVEMTRLMMTAFGIEVDELQPGYYAIAPATYRGTQYQIEPDASAASYFFAAAAITGGEITVQGLSRDALQGDVGFVDALVRMGCREEFRAEGVRLTGGDLKGIDVDMNAISDTAQTLAAVAVFADGPTRIRNVAHMRHKETDRITAVATELSRLGIAVEEHEDGLTIHPGQPQPAVIATYDDHRMAMSFALIGLKAEGIRIADPECTQKTYPRFFDDLRSIFGPAT